MTLGESSNDDDFIISITCSSLVSIPQPSMTVLGERVPSSATDLIMTRTAMVTLLSSPERSIKASRSTVYTFSKLLTLFWKQTTYLRFEAGLGRASLRLLFSARRQSTSLCRRVEYNPWRE